MKTTEERIKALISRQMGIEESTITLDQKFEADLNADSLDLVELVFDVEDAFNIEIPDPELEKFITVQDLVAYVTQRTAPSEVQTAP